MPRPDMPQHRHGTPSGYTYWGCRCEPCRAAASQASAQYKLARSEHIPTRAHGTNNGYNNYLCRCEPCRLAHRAYQMARRLYPSPS